MNGTAVTELDAALRACAAAPADGPFPHDLIRAAIKTLGEDDLANKVYDRAAAGTPWQAIATFLGCAVWSTTDNGAEIGRSTDQWLIAADDERKALIALHLEAYPFLDAAEMERVLTVTAVRFPLTAARCEELIAGRGGRN